MLNRLSRGRSGRLLQAALITAVAYLTMLLNQAEPSGLSQAGAIPTLTPQIQAEQTLPPRTPPRLLPN